MWHIWQLSAPGLARCVLKHILALKIPMTNDINIHLACFRSQIFNDTLTDYRSFYQTKYMKFNYLLSDSYQGPTDSYSSKTDINVPGCASDPKLLKCQS